jgi:D-arabinose 1-dehydrogenase-like Zn-dependent alcohol dehydrogenase
MGFSTTEALTISPEILFKRARIIGSTQNDREHLYEALDYVAKGKVKVMTETFPVLKSGATPAISVTFGLPLLSHGTFIAI